MASSARPNERDTRIGAPDGLHLPGILPEPDVVEGQERDWTPEELAVLDDLNESMPPEDHEETTDREAVSNSPRMAHPRAKLPWWYGALFFAGAALLCFAAAAFKSNAGTRLLFAVVGVVFAWLAGQSWRHRSTKAPPV
jgi:hypothetical protein